VNHSDIFPVRTDRERAASYLKRSAPRRPQAPSQTEALFPEPEHQGRRLVPVVTPEPTELFSELEPTARALVPVNGWPDYQSQITRGAQVAGGGVR
jgi:hypothetical protein